MIHLAFNHDFSKFAENVRGRAARHRGDRRCARRLRPSAGRRPPESRSSRRGRVVATEDDARQPRLEPFPRNSEDGRRRCSRRRASGVDRAASPVGPWPRRSRLRPPRHRVLPARRASPPISAMGSTAGRPCTGSTRRASFGSRSRRRGRGPVSRGRRRGRAVQGDREAIGRRLNVPVVSQSRGRGRQAFRLVRHVRRDRRPASSERTRSLLGWKPTSLGSSPTSIIPPISHSEKRTSNSCAYLSLARLDSSARASSRS